MVREALQLITAKTPHREALRRVGAAMCERYPGHEVAFLDTWNGDELVRAVLLATTDGDVFFRWLNALAPDLRARIGYLQVPEPGVIDCPSVWFE